MTTCKICFIEFEQNKGRGRKRQICKNPECKKVYMMQWLINNKAKKEIPKEV